MNRIPLNIVVTATGQTTDGVLVAVLASDLDALEAKVDVLLPVAQLYVDAFREDEMFTLPEKLRLQEIEDLLADPDGWSPTQTTSGGGWMPGDALIAEGWWHPNVKGGQVHDHTSAQPQTMHRLCEPVYTKRKVQL